MGGLGAADKDPWGVQRLYPVPASLVKPGKNVLTVRVWDRYGDGAHDAALARLHLALLLTLRGTPFLYYGEEIGMTNLMLTDLAQFRDTAAVDRYRLLTEEFGVAPAADASFGMSAARTPAPGSPAETADPLPRGAGSAAETAAAPRPSGASEATAEGAAEASVAFVEIGIGRDQVMVPFHRSVVIARQ